MTRICKLFLIISALCILSAMPKEQQQKKKSGYRQFYEKTKEAAEIIQCIKSIFQFFRQLFVFGKQFTNSSSKDEQRGRFDSYLTTEQSLEKISRAKMITRMEMYKTENIKDPSIPDYYEVLFQLDQMLWVAVSFGEKGLDAAGHHDKIALTRRRSANWLVFIYTVYRPAQILRPFLSQFQSSKVNAKDWSSAKFANTLWSKMTV